MTFLPLSLNHSSLSNSPVATGETTDNQPSPTTSYSTRICSSLQSCCNSLSTLYHIRPERAQAFALNPEDKFRLILISIGVISGCIAFGYGLSYTNCLKTDSYACNQPIEHKNCFLNSNRRMNCKITSFTAKEEMLINTLAFSGFCGIFVISGVFSACKSPHRDNNN